MKTRQNDNMVDRIDVISKEYDTELSRLIGYYMVYDEDEI